MNLDDTKSWISKPDVCQCCLMASGTRDMTIAYFSETGIKEIYMDMLQETFDISLLDWSGALICTLCVTQLRLANTFKKQVLGAVRQFSLYCKTDKLQKNNSPIEEKEIKKSEDSNKIATNKKKLKRSSSKEPIQLNDIRKKVRKKKRGVFRVTTESESREIVDPGYDSDMPIAEFAKLAHCQANDDNCTSSQKAVKDANIFTDEKNVSKVRNEKVSERKRVILTCSIILKDTTACPFRHHKSWFQCFFCLQDFMDIKTLKRHTFSKHKNIDVELKKIKCYPRSLQIEISNLKCRHCCLTLTDVASMRRHLVEVHDKVIYTECIADYKVNASPYSCHLCEREFHVFRTLTTHLNEHYPNCICDVCGKSFLNTKRLEVHKRIHENGTYPCKECGRVFQTKTSISNHIETHTKRIIKCQICFKPMKHYNARIKHMSDEHNITCKFKCPHCYREYNIKQYLSTHMRQTHGQRNKKCSECDMVFINNHDLKKHMSKHTGEKPFTCSICCKSYTRSYTLKEHMRAHDAEKKVSM